MVGLCNVNVANDPFLRAVQCQERKIERITEGLREHERMLRACFEPEAALGQAFRREAEQLRCLRECYQQPVALRDALRREQEHMRRLKVCFEPPVAVRQAFRREAEHLRGLKECFEPLVALSRAFAPLPERLRRSSTIATAWLDSPSQGDRCSAEELPPSMSNPAPLDQVAKTRPSNYRADRAELTRSRIEDRLTTFAWLLPRHQREAFLGDMFEDVTELRHAKATFWKIWLFVLWQVGVGVAKRFLGLLTSALNLVIKLIF